jgi:hypothetical protein
MPPADTTICPILAAGVTAAMGARNATYADARPFGYLDRTDGTPHFAALCLEDGRGLRCAFRRNGLCPPPEGD